MSEPYTWQEYPKWLRHEGQPDTLVQDAAEEAALLAEWTAPAPVEKLAKAAD